MSEPRPEIQRKTTRLTFASSTPTIRLLATGIDRLRERRVGKQQTSMSRVANEYVMPTRRMRILADELNELISKMEMGQDHTIDGDMEIPIPTIDDWLDAALDAYNMRRHREKIFGESQLFGEPTWDILLDLFIAELRNVKMQTTSVCIGAQVPQTTALRWLALLEKEKLVRRYRDSDDSRRVYIQLTELALRKMVQIFYDRCFVMMNKKKYHPPKLSRLSPGTHEYHEAREAILSDTIAQIKIKRYQENGSANGE